MTKQETDAPDSGRTLPATGTEDPSRTLPASEPENTFLAETGVAGTVSGADFERDQVLCRRYRIVRELGRGGMGAVYLCHDEIAGIDVALKAVPPELCRNRDEINEIISNFRIVGKLFHPNIGALKNIELDESTGKYCVVMELVEGSNLHTFRKSRGGRLPLEEVLPIARQVASALDYAHSQKVIHRDIKPSNLMIGPEGQIKVLDFGIATEFQSSLSLVTQASYGTSGTAVYMAPEQWLGRYQDGRTDQYALSCVVYELLTGRPPFECPTFDMMRKAVLSSEVEPPEEVDPGVWRVLSKALAKDRHDRFESCTAFTDALADPAGKGPAALQKGRGRARIAAAAVAVLALAIGVFLFRNRSGTPEPGHEPPSEMPTEMDIVEPPAEEQPTEPLAEPVPPHDTAGEVETASLDTRADEDSEPRPPTEPAIEPTQRLPEVAVAPQPPRDQQEDKPDREPGPQPPPIDATAGAEPAPAQPDSEAGLPAPAESEPSRPTEPAMVSPAEPAVPVVPVPVARTHTRPRVAIIPSAAPETLRAELDASLRGAFMEDGTVLSAAPGIASYLVTALANEEGLDLMEREKFAQVVAEMKLGQNDLSDPAQVARVGRSIEADYLIIPEIRYIHIKKETETIPFIPEPRISHVGTIGLNVRLIEVGSSRVVWAHSGEEIYRERAGRATSAGSGAVFLDRMCSRVSDNVISNVLRELDIHMETEKRP